MDSNDSELEDTKRSLKQSKESVLRLYNILTSYEDELLDMKDQHAMETRLHIQKKSNLNV